MVSRCLISASEARYNCIAPIVWKSTPSNSPTALRSPNQAWVARSEAGYASRPTIEPVAAARNAPLTPNPANNSTRPSCPRAHSPTCSTPRLLGRVNSSESTSTACTSRAAAPGGAGARASNCAAMRCASRSTAAGVSSSNGA